MSNATAVVGAGEDALGHDLSWENIGGIALGWGMFLVLEPLVIWVNFAPWVINPARRPRPPPERYLHACVHSFVAMVFTGGVLFAGFSEQRFHMEDTALKQWFGYNNVCIVFDSPPSTYVCPIFWFAVGYLAVRFANEDSAQRIVPMKHVSERHKTVAKFANTVFAVVAAFFSLCLAIRPEDDMITHSGPFVALVLGFAMLYVLHYFQYQGERPADYTAMVVIYTLLSVVKASFTIVALATGGVYNAPEALAQRVDTVWVALALFAPFFFHPPSATKEVYSEQLWNATEQYRKARLKTYIVVQPNTPVRRDIKKHADEEPKFFLRKGDIVTADLIVGNEIRFAGSAKTGFKGGWLTITARDGTVLLDSTTTYRCVNQVPIFENNDTDSRKQGKVQPGELVEAQATKKNQARGSLQKALIKIPRGWVPLSTVNGLDAVQPARSFKCVREAPIRATSKKNSPTIGYLNPGELINALEVRTSGSNQTKVKFQDSLRGTGWVFRGMPGSSAQVLEEVSSRVPTIQSRKLAMKICELQEQFDQRAGESWRFDTARMVNEVIKEARRRGAVSAPLGLLFFVWLLVGVILHLLGALLKRGVINRVKGSQIFQSVAKLNSSIPNLSLVGGDIVGYAKFTRGWNKFLLNAQQQHNETVFAENIGCPALMALDVDSATKLIFDGEGVQNEVHGMNVRFLPSVFGGQRPNLTRSGDAARITREFLLELMPKDEEDERFVKAVKALGTEFRRWTRMHPADLQDVDAVDAVGQAILMFASHLLLGEALEPELVAYIFPMPGCVPAYPSFVPFAANWFPTWLLPSWWKAKYVSEQLFKQMQGSPNWTVYTVREGGARVFVGPKCNERRYTTRDRSDFDPTQEKQDVLLHAGDRIIAEDIIGEDFGTLTEGSKPMAVRFSQGWISNHQGGVPNNEFKKVPLLEGWVKYDDLIPPLIPRILNEIRGDFNGNPTEQQRLAKQVLTDEAVCGNILIAATFNASSLSNSLMIPFFVLPELLRSNPNLGEDEDLLHSIAWECLRHNGPGLTKQLSKKVSRVTTSKGCPLACTKDTLDETLLQSSEHKEYTVPADTTVCTHLGMLQRDATYWEKPHTFMADRFMAYGSVQKGTDGEYYSADEPFPTLGFGYPLQGQHNLSYADGKVKRTHGCVFGPLMQPFVKEYVRRLACDFHFSLQKTANLELSKTKSGRSAHFATVDGFGPANLTGGLKFTEDMLPKTDGGVRFAVFEFREQVIEAGMFTNEGRDKGRDARIQCYPGGDDRSVDSDGCDRGGTLKVDRAPELRFTWKDIGKNISEVKYAMEFNEVFPAFEFQTDPSKAKFVEEYKVEFPSHRVVPDGMDLEKSISSKDTHEPGMRMGDEFMHVAKVLLQRPVVQRRDDPAAIQARILREFWDLMGKAEAEAEEWKTWDWDPWKIIEARARSDFQPKREESKRKRKGFRAELEAKGLLDREDLKVTDKMVERDVLCYMGRDGIGSLRMQLADTITKLRMHCYVEEQREGSERDPEKAQALETEIQNIRAKLVKLERRYMGFTKKDVDKSVMEVAGVGWCASRRATSDTSVHNSHLVHWDALGISNEIGDQIREVAIHVRELSDYPKAKAELQELAALRYLHEAVDMDNDGAVEQHEVALSHDIDKDMRKLASFGGWTWQFIHSHKRDPQLEEIIRAFYKTEAVGQGAEAAFRMADKNNDNQLDQDEMITYYSNLANQKRIAEMRRQAKQIAPGKKVKLIRPPPHPSHHTLGRSKKHSKIEFENKYAEFVNGKGKELRLGNFTRDEEAEYYFKNPDNAPDGWFQLMEAYYSAHPVVFSKPSGQPVADVQRSSMEEYANPVGQHSADGGGEAIETSEHED